MSVTTTKDQRQETQGRFLEDVRHHVMTIQNDDGLLRVSKIISESEAHKARVRITKKLEKLEKIVKA